MPGERLRAWLNRSRKDVPCDEKGGVCDRIGTNADMALFDELCGLGRCGCVAEREMRGHVLR